jgi:hypothetical protein
LMSKGGSPSPAPLPPPPFLSPHCPRVKEPRAQCA